MVGTRRNVLAVAGGGLAALTLLAGAAMAQTPGGSPTATPDTPAATATATGTAQPGTPQQRNGHDCPEKQGGAQGSSQGASTYGFGRGPRA